MKRNDTSTILALAAVIEDSGLTTPTFASRILGRKKSTVYRWLNDETPIPQEIIAWLDHWTSLSDGTRKRVIGALTAKQDNDNSLAGLAKASNSY